MMHSPLVFTLTLSLALVLGVFTGEAQKEIKLESRPTGTGYALCGACTVPEGMTSRARLAPDHEPGERIILSGTVYAADGVTPDSGITFFLYQTDAGGYYHRPGENVFRPRLLGWLRTGRDGRYEIETIKPAPEILAADEPAHIHVHIWANGMPEHFLHDFWFAGDSRIPAGDRQRLAARGAFSPIVQLQPGKDGVARGVRDIRVRPAPPWRQEPD
jgi:protocatechuate 3,4-dioxygenase beta subunit